MKRYKLLKDLPTFKAGDMFYMSQYGALIYDDGDFGVMAYARSTLEKFPNILKEWFEEIQEVPTDSIHWEPRIGDRCFILENANIRPTFYTGMLRDYSAWRIGKIFRTEEECEKARDRELAEIRLRRTSTFEPDFTLGRGGYSIFYDHIFCGLRVHSLSAIDNGEIVRYETKEEAEKSIEENEQDWLTYFNVEDC
nr:MAG TPA: hypothetical protein [Caudoviricetes sp.]